MTLFQQQFLLDCIHVISQILADEKWLAKAKSQFIGNNSNTRYQGLTSITEALQWTQLEREKVCAAVFEANFMVSTKRYEQGFDNKAISLATSLLCHVYVPRLTAKTKPNQRIAGVLANCWHLQVELQQLKQFDPAESFDKPQTQDDNAQFLEGFTEMSKVPNMPSSPNGKDQNFDDNCYTFFAKITIGIAAVGAVAYSLTR